MPGPAASACLTLAAALLWLLPAGYALLRRLGAPAGGMPGLALAFALGFTLVSPLAWVDARLGGPYLTAGVAALCLVRLRPGRPALAGLARLAPDLLPPLLFAVLALAVNRPDVQADASGLVLRPGFDVSDRLFHTTIAQELARAPFGGIENPVFAGLPLQHAFLPCLLGLLLGVTTPAPATIVFLVLLPVVGLFFVGVAVLGLLEELGVARPARWLTAVLLVLGGDLSFLLPPSPGPFDRFGRFSTFFSRSAESLFYDPWMFGVPLALAALLAGRRFLRDGRRGDLALAALLLAGGWQTKGFAFAAFAAAALLAGVALRSRRLLALGCASAAALPLVVWAAASSGAREGAPFLLSPLFLVKRALANNAGLAALRGALGLAGSVPVFVLGGLGVRLVGLPRLIGEARGDTSGFGAWLATTLGLLLGAGLLLEGNPTAVEAVQFLLLLQSLLWLFAGPALAAIFRRRAPVGVVLLAVAVASPVGYLGRKAAPELLPSAGPLDAAWVRLTPDALSACRFLAHGPSPLDRVLVPVTAREPAAGARSLAIAALAGRRVPAVAAPLQVGRETANARIVAVERVYETDEAAEGERLIERLGVGWVWEDADRPLRFRSDRLSVAFEAGGVRILRVGR